MRALIAIVLIVVVLVLLGWVTIRMNGNNQATVTVEKEKIEKDTHEILEKGGDLIQNAGEKMKSVGHDSAPEKTPDETVPAPATGRE